MKFTKILTLVCAVVFLLSCSSDDKLIDVIDGQLNSGAFIRTLGFNNSDLVFGEPNSTFSVDLEIQDEEGGNLLENIEVFASFNDNNSDNGTSSSQEFLIETIPSDSFTSGENGLPRYTLELSLADLLAGVNISNELARCKDQFILRLTLNLTDGRSFSVEDGSSSVIIAFDTLYSSPFSYTLTIVEPIASQQFTGMYRYTSVVDGPFGPTFGSSKIVEISQGNSINSREFDTDYIVSRQNEPSRTYNFLVACDEVIFGKNQMSSFFSWCRPGGGFSFGGPPILLGPDAVNSIIDPNDDSSFELSFVEGYLGWDGDCEVGTVPVRILFTKQ